MNTLRQSKTGTQDSWTKEQVLAGLQHFFVANQRYPTAREIDMFEYLPSSRSIQRKFGGLVLLRQELIPQSHSDYTRGVERSMRAKESWHRAAKYEEEFYLYLIQHLEPVAVHEHKIMRPGNVSSDYFIYNDDDQGIVIDLFYAKDIYSLSNVVVIKLKRYKNLPYKIIFVLVGNENISIQEIRKMLARKKTSLPPNILLDTENNFKNSTIFKIKQLSKFSRN